MNQHTQHQSIVHNVQLGLIVAMAAGAVVATGLTFGPLGWLGSTVLLVAAGYVALSRQVVTDATDNAEPTTGKRDWVLIAVGLTTVGLLANTIINQL